MKKLASLLLAMLLLLSCCVPALAEDALEILHPINYDEQGFLHMYVRTDFVDDADLNFTAKTENGDLNVVETKVMQKTGTSWFVILDYPQGVNENAEKTEKTILSDLSGLIGDNDNGALVLVSDKPSINVEHAANLRADLKLNPLNTESQYLAKTISDVENYIATNSTMDNVVIVIVSPAYYNKINDTQIDQAGAALNPNITTYILTVAISQSNATSGNTKTWRSQADRLQAKAYATVGGIGYRTDKLTDDEAHEAVDRVRNAERRKVYLQIDPVNASRLGKTITITQTTVGGKTLTAETKLTDADLAAWQETVTKRPENITPAPGSTTRRAILAGNIGVFSTPEPAKKSLFADGIPIELIIGVALGVIIIALLVVFLVTRNGKSKKTTSSAAGNYAAAVGSTAKPAGLTVTLTGANGATLKGQMKNNRLTIGRDANRGAMIAVPNDGKLSGLHATITRNGNVVSITDNGSTNGTKVNGTKVQGTVTLQQNDTVTMGSTTYTVTWR